MPDPAGVLLAHGGELPALGPVTLVTQSRVEPVPALAVVLAVALYAVGVSRLRRRGDAWPPGRSVAWGAGVAVLAAATLSGLAAYDTTLFSAHMVQHMLLSMVAPVLLALGAPGTLALRTLPPRPRGWLLAFLHSRFVRVVTFPLLGFVLWIVSPFALYFSGWYPASLESAVLHELLHLHFLLVGCLYFWPLVGVDPLPRRLPYGGRMLVVAAALPFHAFLGLAIMSDSTLIAAEHYRSLDLPWLGDPLADQATGGGLLWASGELVALGFLAVLFVQWSRASEREAAREDRRLDRLDEARALAAERSGG